MLAFTTVAWHANSDGQGDDMHIPPKLSRKRGRSDFRMISDWELVRDFMHCDCTNYSLRQCLLAELERRGLGWGKGVKPRWVAELERKGSK